MVFLALVNVVWQPRITRLHVANMTPCFLVLPQNTPVMKILSYTAFLVSSQPHTSWAQAPMLPGSGRNSTAVHDLLVDLDLPSYVHCGMYKTRK
jgi:hypothetical protein